MGFRFGAVLVVAGICLPAGRADACGATPAPNYTLSGMTPEPGASNVARNAGLLLRGQAAWAPGGRSVFAEVKLTDVESGEEVPVTLDGWSPTSAGEDVMVVRPVEPLAALRRYRLQADPQDSELGDLGGSVFVSDFETSEALLEAVTLSGKLDWSLRGADVEVQECTSVNSCGTGDCSVTGTRRALLADVRLPVTKGGQGVYIGTLHFTDNTPVRPSDRSLGAYEEREDEPHSIRLTQPVRLEAGEALTLQQEIFDTELPYRACFTFIVWDPAGHVAHTSACLPSLSSEDIRTLAAGEATRPLAADAGTATDPVDPSAVMGDARDNPPFIRCAIDPGSGGTSTSPHSAFAWLTLFSALLASALLRRGTRSGPNNSNSERATLNPHA